MLDVVNIKQKFPQLDEITAIKWVLPAKQNQVIFIGYSNQSVANMQYIYQLFDYKQSETKLKGRISNFGIIFLSQYVAYKDDGDYLMLCESMGTRKIIKQNFLFGVCSTYIKEIPKLQFQLEAGKEWSCIHYSEKHNKLYLLQISQFSHWQTNLFFRVYSQDIEISSFRLICLETSFPKIVFSPQHILCLNEDQFVLYKENFQQVYFNIDNMDQFRILGFFYQMILQYKEDKSIFSMSMNGTLKPLVEQLVVSHFINENYISFLYLKQNKYRIAAYQYKNKTLHLKGDIDAGVSRATIKSGGFKIVQANKHQILISDTEHS